MLVSGTPARLMLLHEAATRALAVGTTHASPLLGRPTCMAIPAALSSGVASSLGCIGNRVYTGITDDEFYTVIAGKDLASVVARARHDHLGQRGADRLSPGPTGVACHRVAGRRCRSKNTDTAYWLPATSYGLAIAES